MESLRDAWALVEEDRNVVEINGGQQCPCLECHRAVHLKMVKMIHCTLHIFHTKKGRVEEKRTHFLLLGRFVQPIMKSLCNIHSKTETAHQQQYCNVMFHACLIPVGGWWRSEGKIQPDLLGSPTWLRRAICEDCSSSHIKKRWPQGAKLELHEEVALRGYTTSILQQWKHSLPVFPNTCEILYQHRRTRNISVRSIPRTTFLVKLSWLWRK